MNVKAKKMLSLVLAFVMVLGMLPATVFATNEAGRFADVPAGTWFSNPVQYVSDNGLMVGVDDNHFAPGGLTTRCMVVKVLHSMEGEPSAEGTGFTDVEDGVWYTEAILWAQANGIVEGYGDGTFRPHASMTREEMMAVIYSYSQYKGYDVSETTSLRVFTDSVKIQSYAEDAMAWAVSVGLIVGFEDGTIRPQADSNRAQLATVLMRFVNGSDSIPDEQKVPTEIADYYGVNPDDYDTDGDGLSNYVEIYLTGTDPKMMDSDENGINDEDEDADADGLSNAHEIELGTNPAYVDTDGDGLTDGEEVEYYFTNPCEYDTDNDTIYDGDEILLGLNPNSTISDGITPDFERTFVQELSEKNIDERIHTEDNSAIPSLTLDAVGNINRYVSIDVSSADGLLDSRAIIGKTIEISAAGVCEGTLSFTLNNSDVSFITLEDTDEKYPAMLICKKNDDGSIDYLTTEYADNVLSAEIDSQGTYYVLDVKNLFDELGLSLPAVSNVDMLSDKTAESIVSKAGNNGTSAEITSNDVAPVSVDSIPANKDSVKITKASSSVMAQADVVFIIDTTGSMGDEIDNVIRNIGDFVNTLKEKGVSAGLALIDYQDINADGYDSTRVHKNGSSNWFYDMDSYLVALSNLGLGWGGDEPECAVDALETARLLDMRASAGKIFVLVTDAGYKVDNRYSIPSMATEIELLKNAGVNCCVVSPSELQDTYHELYAGTEGIWANIYGNFYEELIMLANEIGNEIVGDGYWIYLDGPIPVPVRLDAIPQVGSDVDTDKDGVPDIDELEGAEPTGYVDLDVLITAVSHGAITGTDYGIVRTYKYHSNPIETDTDFDGIADYDDIEPNNNHFKGKTNRLKDNKVAASGAISFVVDYTDFFEDNTVYNKDISVLSSLFAADIYSGKSGVYIEVTSGASLMGNHEPDELLKLFGMDDIVTTDIGSDNDKTEIIIGHRLVEYNGTQRDIVLLSVRGTNGTFAEWSSNFDVGANTEAYKSVVDNEDEWEDYDNHKGFDVTANRVKTYVDTYLNEYVSDDAEHVLWITGHSRGAGIANILGALYTDNDVTTFVYTFAAPNTTTKAETTTIAYTSIFNIVNSDDLIPYLPLDAWGFRKYGITKQYTISIEENYEDSSPFGNKAGTFEALLDMDYNNNGKIDKTLKAFLEVAKNRSELYTYTYEDNTYQLLDINRSSYDEASKDVENARKSINSTMLQFCEFQVLKGENGFGSTVYRGACYQTPAYFMQVLALIAAESGKGIGDAVSALTGNAVAKKYEGARNKFALIGNDITGGLNHPHWTESYYLIAKNNFKDI